MSVKKYLGETSLALLWAKIKAIVPSTYAGSSSAGGSATRANAIPMGQVDSTSTSTVFTATIDGVTELYDGLCIYLRNGVVTSASGWTLNINGLGAKPVYQTQADAGRLTTAFNIAYTGLFIYNSTRVSGGCWDYFYGYNSDTNTLAYMIRMGQTNLSMHSALYRYQICFTMMNGEILPANSVSNSTATSKTLTTESFDPFGQIYYYNTTTTVEADASPSASYMWTLRHDVDLRYSFNCGKTLTAKSPVYVKCSPQADGTVKLAGDACITQTLPSTEDGYVYIHLGRAYSTYQIVLDLDHPIFHYFKGALRLWTNQYAPTATSELTNDSGFITSASLPTKTSDLTNDSGYSVVHVIPYTEEYIQELDEYHVVLSGATYNDLDTWLDNHELVVLDSRATGQSFYPCGRDRGELDFANSHGTIIRFYQDNYGLFDEIPETDPVFQESPAYNITSSDITSWNNKSDFSGSYNDLTNKPTIPIVPTNVSAFTNDAGYLTSYTETDPTVPSWAKASTKPTYTASEVGAAAASHSHGDITSGGDITATATIANGDRLVINDESASKVTNSSITFGNSTTSYLANNGTWQTPNIPTVPTNVSAFTNDAGYVQGRAEYNDTTATIGTTAGSYFQSSFLQVENYGEGLLNQVRVENNGVSVSSTGGSVFINSSDQVNVSGNGGVIITDNDSEMTEGIDIMSYYGGVHIYNVVTPISSDMAASKGYVDNAIPSTVSSFTNDAGYLTLATLPIYNGSYSQVNS